MSKSKWDKWYRDANKRVRFAKVLLDAGEFKDKAHVIRYFEDPWSWDPVHKFWEEMGKPTVDNREEWADFMHKLARLRGELHKFV